MAVLLALAAAASWGASDFLGGLAGRRAAGDPVAVAFTSQLIGLAGLTLLAVAASAPALSAADVWLSAGAGAGGAAGVALLYRGLAIGKMGVVAPVTGAGAAALPVVYGALIGELPSAAGWAGVALAVVAIVLVSREPIPHGERRGGLRTPGLLEAVGAGLGFGVIFVLLDATSADSGLWPLVPMKVVACTLLLGLGVATGRRLLPERGAAVPVVGVGLLDNLANVAYLLAARQGIVALVAVVSSLYPVGTVLLARLVLAERLARHQVGGLVLAGVAVVLLALG